MQVVEARGRKDRLEGVAQDCLERAQRQMIRNHYEAQRQGALQEGRNEVIQVRVSH